ARLFRSGRDRRRRRQDRRQARHPLREDPAALRPHAELAVKELDEFASQMDSLSLASEASLAVLVHPPPDPRCHSPAFSFSWRIRSRSAERWTGETEERASIRSSSASSFVISSRSSSGTSATFGCPPSCRLCFRPAREAPQRFSGIVLESQTSRSYRLMPELSRSSGVSSIRNADCTVAPVRKGRAVGWVSGRTAGYGITLECVL